MILERGFGRLEGVKSAKVAGADKFSKYYYLLEIPEKRKLLPSDIKKLLNSTKALQKFPYQEFTFDAVTGTVAVSGERHVFTARGSGQKYALKLSDDLRELVAAGKSKVTLGGGVVEPPAVDGKKPLPVLTVTDAEEAEE